MGKPSSGADAATAADNVRSSDCLRMEVAPFGIDVIVIEPGGIRTGWSGIAAHRRSSPPQLIGKTITKAVTTRNPRTRYAVGYGAKPMILMHNLLPDRTFDTFIRRATGVPSA